MSIMNEIFTKIKETGIIPVVVLEHTSDALPLGDALIQGGLPCAEITFRTNAASASLQLLSEKYPEMLLGAGTILTTRQVDCAIDAGARFIVSPGFNPKVVSYCISKDIPIIPGCSTPSDIEQALEFGLNVVKFFPAEAAGGIKYIKALAAPYHQVKFMPTGGITPENVSDYLSHKSVIACGGSWMVKSSLIQAHDFSGIKNLALEASAIAARFRD